MVQNLKLAIMFGMGWSVGVLTHMTVTSVRANVADTVDTSDGDMDGWDAMPDTGTGIAVSVEPVLEDYTFGCHFDHPENLNLIIHSAAEEFDVNPRAIALTVWRESGCRADAVGGSGELGLMQINPSVWSKTMADNGFVSLSDPTTNVRAGAWILAQHKAKTGDSKRVIRKYNGAGPMARKYASEQAAKYLEVWGTEITV